MASWGNQTGQQFNQDMESPSGYHLYATKNNANDAAIKGSNDSGLAVHSDGKLKVDGDSDLNGDLDVSGTLKSDTVVGSSGNLVEIANVNHGNVNLGNGSYIDSIVKSLCSFHCNGSIDTISAVPLTIGQSYQNNASSIELGRSGINIYVRGELRADDHVVIDGSVDLDNTLDLDANTAGVALDVNNSNTGTSCVGISATGRTALQAYGHIALDSNKALALDGSTGENYIKYNSTQSRIEFYIGGNLVFTVDSNGGHNP
jgi:hypothetical protein